MHVQRRALNLHSDDPNSCIHTLTHAWAQLFYDRMSVVKLKAEMVRKNISKKIICNTQSLLGNKNLGESILMHLKT